MRKTTIYYYCQKSLVVVRYGRPLNMLFPSKNKLEVPLNLIAAFVALLMVPQIFITQLWSRTLAWVTHTISSVPLGSNLMLVPTDDQVPFPLKLQARTVQQYRMRSPRIPSFSEYKRLQKSDGTSEVMSLLLFRYRRRQAGRKSCPAWLLFAKQDTIIAARVSRQ
jgi:hypothetical protein